MHGMPRPAGDRYPLFGTSSVHKEIVLGLTPIMMAQSYPASGTLHDDLWIKKVPSKYTPDQVARYLLAIGYNTHFDAAAISSGAFPINLENLERLMLLHLLTFPFENTPMH
jgi:hypothetical protein